MADMHAASRSCFTAEMLLDCDGGRKRADQIQLGDLLWSQPEGNPDAKAELKPVEEVFVRTSPVLTIRVAGQAIRTTAEHPFWVEGEGWLPAGFLRPGDLLRTRGGLLIAVEAVENNGEVETVYNWRIGEFHTYYVSAVEDGVSLWAHNVYYNNNDADVAAVTRRPGMRLVQKNGKYYTETIKNGQPELRAATGKYDFVTRNGEIRVLRPGDPVSTHTALAGNGPVDYAGQIRFSGRTSRGKIREWDNGSGHFNPEPHDAHMAGLPMDLFRPVSP